MAAPPPLAPADPLETERQQRRKRGRAVDRALARRQFEEQLEVRERLGSSSTAVCLGVGDDPQGRLLLVLVLE